MPLIISQQLSSVHPKHVKESHCPVVVHNHSIILHQTGSTLHPIILDLACCFLNKSSFHQEFNYLVIWMIEDSEPHRHLVTSISVSVRNSTDLHLLLCRLSLTNMQNETPINTAIECTMSFLLSGSLLWQATLHCGHIHHVDSLSQRN